MVDRTSGVGRVGLGLCDIYELNNNLLTYKWTHREGDLILGASSSLTENRITDHVSLSYDSQPTDLFNYIHITIVIISFSFEVYIFSQTIGLEKSVKRGTEGD